jgi:hypothetical protein
MKKILRKFGNLTLFDYLLIGLLAFGVIVFAYIFFRTPTYLTVSVKVGEESLAWGPAYSRTWFAQLFRKGIKERDGVGRNMAEVTEVYVYPISPDRQAVYLTLRLRSTYQKASKQHIFKGKPILVGYPIKLQLDTLNVEGIVTNIEGLPDPRTDVKLKIEVRSNGYGSFQETTGAPPAIADALRIGQTVNDSSGQVVIEIVDKKEVDAKRLTTTYDGRTVIATNPLLKDIQLTLVVNAKKINNRYFLFDDIPLAIGGQIPLILPEVNFWPEITQITEVK